MCGYRIWGLVAGLIGFILTYFLLDIFGLNISSEDKETIGILVGLGIYVIPLIISSLVKKIT